MVTTKWGQDAPYNNFCPNGAVTGCVATALAQIVNFWEWPTTLPSVSHPYYGNIGAYTMNWSALDGDMSSNEFKTNVAQLMVHCGYEMNMQYGWDESGTQSELAQKALFHFGFDNSARTVSRTHYSTAEWESLIYSELEAGCPVMYSGRTVKNEGHAFVCDGYDVTGNLFHINWGWNGRSDGFFLLSALDPYSQGIGGSASNYGFNIGQTALIGISHNKYTGNKYPNYLLLTDIQYYEEYSNAYKLTFGNYNGVASEFELGIGYIDSDNNIHHLRTIELDGTPKRDVNPGSWFSFWPAIIDPSDFTNESDGVYKVVFLSKQYGTTQWYNACAPNQFVTVNKNGSNYTFEINSQSNFSATIKSVSGTLKEGYPVSVNITLTNEGTIESDEVRLAVLAPDGLTRYECITPVFLEAGKSKDYTLSFIPYQGAGTYTLYICNKLGRALASDEITCQGSIKVSNVSFKAGYEPKYIITLKNFDTETYSYNKIRYKLYIAEIATSSYYGSSVPSELSIEPIAPGEEKDFEIVIPDFSNDKRYLLNDIIIQMDDTNNLDMSVGFIVDLCAINIGDAGMITYASNYALNLSPENLDFGTTTPMEAFIGKVEGNSLVLTKKETNIPGKTGLVIKGAPNTTYAVPATNGGDAVVNDLVAVTENIDNLTSNSVYVLGKNTSGNLGFYLYSGTSISAGHAYLPADKVTTSASAPLRVVFDDGTGLGSVEEECRVDDAIFNLHGQKVSENYKGIVIKNGKKYLIK